MKRLPVTNRRGFLGQAAAVSCGLITGSQVAWGQTKFRGTCVQYVKAVKPEYKRLSWVPARDLWDLVADKGSSPKYQSILVIDSFAKNTAGHVAIVMRGSGNRIQVVHANWDRKLEVTTGWFTLVKGGVKYDGWQSTFPVRGFVYSAR